jgi:hypothetical protein
MAEYQVEVTMTVKKTFRGVHADTPTDANGIAMNSFQAEKADEVNFKVDIYATGVGREGS